jgi:hypothetical protein
MTGGDGDVAGDRARLLGINHVALAVGDLDAVERRLDELDAERLPTSGVDVRDPWGSRLQLVAYSAVQFTKAAHVLDGMAVDRDTLAKTDGALAELAGKGMTPEE